jgi:hypothetical protein
MSLLHKDVEQKSSYKVTVQLALTLFCLYIANNKTIDIWRSLTGH